MFSSCPKVFKSIKCLLITLVFTSAPQIKANELTKITLATQNLCPYGCYQDKNPASTQGSNEFSGIAVDVVKCALNKMNISLELLVLPWARAQKYALQTNKADGFFSASQNHYRDQFATLSYPIAKQKWQWYVLNSNTILPTDSNFKQQATVGAFIGSNMLKWLENNNYKILARPLNTDYLLQMLLKERLDAILANDYVTDRLITKYGVDKKVTSYLHMNKPLGVYFSNTFLKNNKLFLPAFNKKVRECRKIQ
ncbi:substrate-binding periplasmic protein [Litorilituus lipolyticus]|uniref:substrate-binding periplasmic protein n=1 Tax=Litorilituus lipolyticus TaxID=2491017 RepID=UPI00147901CD|nr:transporter substrate-binding domain-containing protein [Litorilituus lipolyticus]